MRRYFILLLVLTYIATGYSQDHKTDRIFTYQSFDNDVFNFVPIKRDGVTDDQFNFAVRILEETKLSTNADPKKMNVADYWNITGAFVKLKEPAINIEIAFKKAIALDANAVCSYVKKFHNYLSSAETIRTSLS